MTRTLRCTVQYDGGMFAGFQRQSDQPTVQGALEEAVATVTQEAVTVQGAGRTDAGVHAVGQVIHFHSTSTLPAALLQRAVNACLPQSVVITAISDETPDFHARYSAKQREYRYVVENAPLHSPLWRQRAYHVPQPLSVEAMNTAARPLVGSHDFAAFGSPMKHSVHDATGMPGQVTYGSTMRTMLMARCWQKQRFILFGFVADAFLRHMVRMLVGTLLRIGSGRLAPGALVRLLQGDRSLSAGPAAPAHGLYLMRVTY